MGNFVSLVKKVIFGQAKVALCKFYFSEIWNDTLDLISD